jgi:iron complex outermembrane receptor protein
MLYDEKYVGYNFEVDHLFFNPRIGFNYKFSPALSSYISFARVNREPRLKTYYDAAESSGGETPQFERNADGSYDFDEPLVQPETMNDVELGFHFKKSNYNLSLNFFYMQFNNEIVSQGQTDRFGQPITGNVDRTIHTGVEVSTTGRFLDHFEVVLNGSYSKNYISKGKTFVNYTGANGNAKVGEIDLSDNRISGFPDVTINGIFKLDYEGFLAQFFTKYVGSIRSDNYDDNLKEYLNKYPGFVSYDDNKVESYFVMDMMLSYNFNIVPFFTNAEVFFKVDNVFDNLYASYAIGKEFFPAAERNFLTGIKVGL